MSSHISFMLQDVIDLRKDGWVPRHQESLETIEQIHKTQPEKEKEESLQHVASIPLRSGRNRDMPDKGRALKPQKGSDEWQMNENPSRRGLQPDINRTQGILSRYRGKETTAGLKPQGRSLKPQGSSIIPMETKRDTLSMKAPLRMEPKGVSNRRPLSSDTSQTQKASTHRVAFIPDSSRERKTVVELVPQMKCPR